MITGIFTTDLVTCYSKNGTKHDANLLRPVLHYHVALNAPLLNAFILGMLTINDFFDD